MNFRLLESIDRNNEVLIKSTKAIFPYIVYMLGYKFPIRLDRDLSFLKPKHISKTYKKEGKIIDIFRHQKGWKLYIVEINLRDIGISHIICGRSAFKCLSPISLKVNDYIRKKAEDLPF